MFNDANNAASPSNISMASKTGETELELMRRKELALIKKRYSRTCSKCGGHFTCLGIRGDGSACPALKEGSCLCPKCWSNMTGFPSEKLTCVISEVKASDGQQRKMFK